MRKPDEKVVNKEKRNYIVNVAVNLGHNLKTKEAKKLKKKYQNLARDERKLLIMSIRVGLLGIVRKILEAVKTLHSKPLFHLQCHRKKRCL